MESNYFFFMTGEFCVMPLRDNFFNSLNVFCILFVSFLILESLIHLAFIFVYEVK